MPGGAKLAQNLPFLLRIPITVPINEVNDYFPSDSVMNPARPLPPRLPLTQQLLRCAVGTAVLVACFAGPLPRTTESNTESPAESTEVAIECFSRTRVSDPRENGNRSEQSLAYCSSATNPYSPTHPLPAASRKGHRLPNGLPAPLRC